MHMITTQATLSIPETLAMSKYQTLFGKKAQTNRHDASFLLTKEDYDILEGATPCLGYLRTGGSVPSPCCAGVESLARQRGQHPV
ncbi:hypothetical protein RJ639_018066 [Escallonia herrerae]|uniref:Uncharacterized protein n=1 Tax=Escallonia herrerae TaxID=1293975 RepID=A0AA88VD32_9ASTE|nr:hypothetical protein RJ639_018066 [Escallonia herrerae]